MYSGMWSTNNGNTWSNHVYTAKSRIGLLRKMAPIIDGNLTGYHDKGVLRIWGPGEDISTTQPEYAYRNWSDNKWHYDA